MCEYKDIDAYLGNIGGGALAGGGKRRGKGGKGEEGRPAYVRQYGKIFSFCFLYCSCIMNCLLLLLLLLLTESK